MTPERAGPPVLGMILKGYPRISEAFISNEILLLERLGFTIHIFSMRHPREAFSHESVKQIRARVDYLPQELLRPLPVLLYHNLLLAVRRPFNYGRAVKTAARRFLRTRKSATLKHLFQAGYLVHKLLPESGVVRFHAHFAHSPTSVALFAGRLSGLPFSFTAHAKDIYTQNPKQVAEKIGLARFVVTCTEYNRRYLSDLDPDSRTDIHRIYHGIDMTLFSGEEGIREPAEPYRILTVARLTEKKGLPTLYRAIRILRDRGVNMRHTLIGDGDDREEFLNLIRSLELTDACRWAGTLPHEKVLDHYRRSHLFALACQVAPNGDRDGIPNVLIESMAMGVPVVSTELSAIPELVRDGETGLLVAPRNPEALADAMVRLLTDTELRRRIIPAARAEVAERFSNRALIGELAEIHRRHL